MEGWKKSLYFCVIFLLGIFFGWILSFISEDKKKSSVGMSEINVFPGHSYSLLIDNERFPLDVHPYEKIKILIKPGKKNKRFNFLPPRVQIPYTPKEEKMSVVRENRFLFRYDTPNALKEFRLSKQESDKFNVGDEVKVTIFEKGSFVDITSKSKGRGFTGVLKRHNFGRPTMSHGTHENFRHGGSIGCATPARVIKGKKMPGHYGNAIVTIQNLEVVDVIEDKNLLLVRGAVPGSNQSMVRIRQALKKPAVKK